MLRFRPRLWRRRRTRSRAQGLVEFALVLPVLLLLLLLAIDFGRALYGWVILQNSARIAANFAGLNPDAWEQNIDPVKDRYQADISADLDTANCSRPVSPTTPLPDPVFTDGPDSTVSGGSADSQYDVGDTVTVVLNCTFRPITPIIGAILGNSITLTASSEFRIRVGDVAGLPNPTRMPPPATPTPSSSASSSASASASASASTCAPPVAQFSGAPRNGVSPLSVNFTDASTTGSGCPITVWEWTFGNGQTSTQQTPLVQQYLHSGPGNTKYTVSLTVTNAGGTDTETKSDYITAR